MSTQSKALTGHINAHHVPAAASVDELRAARLSLAARIREGATYLQPIFDEVEDALIEQLARAHRDSEGHR